MKRIQRKFYIKDTIIIARNLLGKIIIYKSSYGTISIQITETEAYLGEQDLASHARFGLTKRNFPMYLEGGHLYIYFIYGLHYMLNIVTEPKGSPGAVLIRKAIIIDGLDTIKKIYSNKNIKINSSLENGLDGPAKICQALGINYTLNQIDLVSSNLISLFENPHFNIEEYEIYTSKRIGINTAKEWQDKLFRFTLVTKKGTDIYERKNYKKAI